MLCVLAWACVIRCGGSNATATQVIFTIFNVLPPGTSERKQEKLRA